MIEIPIPLPLVGKDDTPGKVLVICPTKDRPEFLNTMIQNLIMQDSDVDLFVGDMSTDPNLLKNNWFVNIGMQHYEKVRHRTIVLERVSGINQLAGYTAGLKFAVDMGYDLAVGTDDDIIFEQSWFRRGKKEMVANPDYGILVGMTLLPHIPIVEQTCPPHMLNHPEYQGTLEVCHYAHCTFLPPSTEPRTFQQLYGPFFFRPKDVKACGGFPSTLSPLGFRGEMQAQTCQYWSGKKLVLDPLMWSWHYSCPYAGLRELPPPGKDTFLKQDLDVWIKFLARGKPTTVR